MFILKIDFLEVFCFVVIKNLYFLFFIDLKMFYIFIIIFLMCYIYLIIYYYFVEKNYINYI